MSLDLIPENDLRAVLRPHRVDPQHFEAAVRQRLQSLQAPSASDPLVRLSPFAKAAAAFLPLEVLAGCQAVPAVTKAAPAGGFYKLLSYLAFPAISLFVLLGATVFSFLKIRSIQEQSTANLGDQQATQESIQDWWRQHRLGASVVFAVSLTLMLLGATSLLFLFYLISFGLLLFVLSSFAKIGIGNRDIMGRTCGMGLMFLGQATGSVAIGSQEIHFLDQSLISVIFFTGLLFLVPFVGSGWQASAIPSHQPQPIPRWYWVFYASFVLFQLGLLGLTWSLIRMPFQLRLGICALLVFAAMVPVVSILLPRWFVNRGQWTAMQRGRVVFLLLFLIPLMTWNARTLLRPATPARIKRYVESFDHAPHSSASWANWEIPARWTIDAGLQPDLSKPRHLLNLELAGEQNPYVLSSAMRSGLITPDQLRQLKNYDQQRRLLLRNTPGIQPQSVHLGQFDWVVRAAVAKNDLSTSECDELERLLLATIDNLLDDKYVTLEKADNAVQLLSVIDRPIDRERYRSKIHELLRGFHHTSGGWGRVNGGFRSYKSINAGDPKATAHAVQLMEVFGIPDDLNIFWVRSFLRPGKILDQQWIAAATLARLNAIPTARSPSWFDYLYHERTILAAIALVGLCLYATFSSPAPRPPLPDNQPCPS
jgi:hypothetical protein